MSEPVTGENDAQMLSILYEIASILNSSADLTIENKASCRKLLADIARLQAGSQTSLPFGKGSVNI